MKNTYVKPTASIEEFVANEFVSSCYDYKCQVMCAIPGNSNSKINDGNDARNDHGICGSWSGEFQVNGVNGGFETVNNVVNTKRPINNIQIGTKINASTMTDFSTNIGSAPAELEKNGYYKATWTSVDNENHTGSYNHYGCLKITSEVQQIPGRPNHS